MERKVTALTVSDFGCLKATGYSNGEIEVETGGKMPLYWHQLPVLGLAFSVFQDVPILGSVSADRTVTLWQPKLGKWRVMKKDLVFNVEVTSIAFDPGCENFAIGLEDGTVEVRMVGGDFAVNRQFKLDCGPVKLAYLHNGLTLVCADGNGKITFYRNYSPSEVIATPDRSGVRDMSVSPDDRIALVFEDCSVVVVGNGRVEQLQESFGENKPMLCFWEPVTNALRITMENGTVATVMQGSNGRWKQV